MQSAAFSLGLSPKQTRLASQTETKNPQFEIKKKTTKRKDSSIESKSSKADKNQVK